MRCYLKALAHRDRAGLLAVADDHPPVCIIKADLRHSADARSGPATATFTPNPSDPYNGVVSIAYADGARDRLGIQNMIAFGGLSAWRLAVGTPISPSPGGPLPASSSPPGS